MLVQLAGGLTELHLNTGHGRFDLSAGEQVQMDRLEAFEMIKQGLLVKAEYQGFDNDEIIVVEFKDEIGWRPVGRKVKR